MFGFKPEKNLVQQTLKKLNSWFTLVGSVSGARDLYGQSVPIYLLTLSNPVYCKVKSKRRCIHSVNKKEAYSL